MNSNWTPDIKPAMITDDIGFVGGKPVSVHAILSSEGPILLDSGYPNMFDGIGQNMRALGLAIEDVVAIVLTHGHIDHFGSAAEIAKASGAKIYIGAEDADILTGKTDLSWAKELGLPRIAPFTPDACFEDGHVLKIADRQIRCIHAPGHTEGTYAFFIDTKADGRKAIAAMHGGIGMNSLAKAFLESYGLPLNLRERFREGLHKLAHEHVDIVLGNHPPQNDTEGKLSKLGCGSNPFVNPDEWSLFLKNAEARLDDLLATETAAL